MRVTVTGAPMRLDRYLRTQAHLAHVGRRGLAELLATGGVRVNGARARKGTMVGAGDTITVALPPPRTHSPSPPLDVLYADDDVVALDKPPGIPTTIGRTPGASLAGALLDRYPDMGAFGDPRHAGLVHRLDTGTSGLLLAARHAESHARLRSAFTQKRVAKSYLAVVVGRVLAPVVVDTALTRHPRSRRRVIVAPADRGWPARTEVVPIAGDADLTVVRLQMRTGVTHQLRVHLASIGHAILGDPRYGSAAATPDVGGTLASWHFLHARALAFDDPNLPHGLVTPFPVHWRPLFETRGWPHAHDP